MALKNQALTVCYVAWDTSANAGKTGDSANHTIKLVQDGTEAAATNAPAEVDSTNAPGVYKLALTAGDMNFNCVVLCGKSSTAGIAIIPVTIVTERGVLPTVAPASSGGFVTAGTSANQLSTASGGVVTVGTNSDKTGYALTQSFPSNFAALGISAAGKINEVVLCDTLTTYTGNTPQTGDSYARIGSTGSGLTTLATASALATLSTAVGSDFSSLSSQLGTPMQAGNVTVGGYATGQGPAALVLDVAIAGHETAGTVGAAIAAAGSAGDPWATALPGSYAAGTAGKILGTNLDAAVSSRLATSGYTAPPSAATIAEAILATPSQLLQTDAAGHALVSLTQTLSAARALDSIADTSLTLNDAFHCAASSAAGQLDASSGTSMIAKTPHTATTLRTFTLTVSGGNAVARS